MDWFQIIIGVQYWKKKYINYNNFLPESLQIPPKIDNPERIVRVLMNPRHFKSKDILKWNCFRSPAGIDEVSVIRLEYCSEQFSKDWGKQNKKTQKILIMVWLYCWQRKYKV